MTKKSSQPAPRKSKMSARKKASLQRDKTDGLMGEFLNQITHAAYLVALKTGFRGSFINFLSELQEALEGVIRQDNSHARFQR